MRQSAADRTQNGSTKRFSFHPKSEVLVRVLYPLAEGRKRIQTLLVLGGVTHHCVVTTTSLQQNREADLSVSLGINRPRL